jgi:hypothetical protein
VAIVSLMSVAGNETAIPGEVPLSGACGEIQLLGLEDTQVRREW